MVGILTCAGSAAMANRFSVGTAADFTTGNYGGTAATDIWYVPFTARYDKGRASFRVTVPYVEITGPGNVLGPGIGGVTASGLAVGGSGAATVVVCDEEVKGCLDKYPDRGGGENGDAGAVVASGSRADEMAGPGLTGGISTGGVSFIRTSQAGLGDVVAAFSYNLIDHTASGTAFDITTRIKLPTADDSRFLGSGRVDYAVQGDLYQTIAKWTFVATLGYRILGDPSGFTFQNVLFGAASLGYRLSPNVALGASYTTGQSPVRLQDGRDVTFYLTRRITDQVRLNVYGLRGFSERSPDWGGGVNVRYVF